MWQRGSICLWCGRQQQGNWKPSHAPSGQGCEGQPHQVSVSILPVCQPTKSLVLVGTLPPLSPSILNFNCFFSLRYWCCWKDPLVFLFFLNLSGEKIQWSMLVVDSLISEAIVGMNILKADSCTINTATRCLYNLLGEMCLYPCIGMTQQPTQWMSTWYADHTTTCQEHHIIDGISWGTVD